MNPGSYFVPQPAYEYINGREEIHLAMIPALAALLG
jgi:hypothetical protein